MNINDPITVDELNMTLGLNVDLKTARTPGAITHRMGDRAKSYIGTMESLRRPVKKIDELKQSPKFQKQMRDAFKTI